MKKALADFIGIPLIWTEPTVFHNVYELRNEQQELLASLRFISSCGSLAVAETAHGNWSFKRVGFLNPRVTIRVNDAETDLAVYHPRLFSGGTIVFASGLSVEWRPSSIWQTYWAFQDSQQRPIVQFSPGPSGSSLSSLFKTQATVVIQQFSLPIEHVAMLAVLGFYFMVLHQQDSAVAGTVAATVAVS